MEESPPRRVLRLWTRAASRAPTQDCEALELTTGQGVVGDHTFGSKRHVTVIFEDDWRAATAALGQEVDPSARRANVLLSGAAPYLKRELGVPVLSSNQAFLWQLLRLAGVDDRLPQYGQLFEKPLPTD